MGDSLSYWTIGVACLVVFQAGRVVLRQPPSGRATVLAKQLGFLLFCIVVCTLSAWLRAWFRNNETISLTTVLFVGFENGGVICVLITAFQKKNPDGDSDP